MNDCAICDYAKAHGWWGPLAKNGTHCSTCHRTWQARGQAHCTVCHEHFASNGVANYHWGSGKSAKSPAYGAKHLDPHELPTLIQDANGVWHGADKRPGDFHGTHINGTGDAETADGAPEDVYESSEEVVS